MSEVDLSAEEKAVRGLLAETREQLADNYHKELCDWLFGVGVWERGCPFLTKTYPKILEAIESATPGTGAGTSSDMETFCKGEATVVKASSWLSVETPREGYSPYLDIIEEIAGGGCYVKTVTSGWSALRKIDAASIVSGAIVTLANLEELSAKTLNGLVTFRGCAKLAKVKIGQLKRHSYDGAPYYGLSSYATPTFETGAQGLTLDLSECELGDTAGWLMPATMAEVAQLPGCPFGLDALHGKIVCTDGTLSY